MRCLAEENYVEVVTYENPALMPVKILRNSCFEETKMAKVHVIASQLLKVC
jgi:hypothetical protein